MPCGACGSPTARKSGLCRHCDPAHKTGGGSAAKGKPAGGKNHLPIDETAAPVTAAEVAQCGFEFVPTSAGGGGGVRRCKNAVRTPAHLCHRHGGPAGSSFAGKTYAKAVAEAERGELRPVAPSWWAGAEARYEALEGQVAAMLATDPSRLGDMYARLSAQRAVDGTGRFSTGNQLMMLVQHAHNLAWDADGNEVPISDVLDQAMGLMAEPHMTASNWEKAGRRPLPGAAAVPVMHYRPGEWLEREPGETDEEWAERRRNAAGHRRYLLQYPLSATDGDPYTQPPSPLDQPLPAGHGNPNEVLDQLAGYAASQGLTVTYVDDKPAGGAEGYYLPDTGEVVVWNGTAGGDPAARAHVVAHEVGHAVMGHGTDASAEDRRGDREAAAETFAYLVTSRFGIDSAEMSSWYIGHWQPQAGVNLANGGVSAVKSAIVAADDLFAGLLAD